MVRQTWEGMLVKVSDRWDGLTWETTEKAGFLRLPCVYTGQPFQGGRKLSRS